MAWLQLLSSNPVQLLPPSEASREDAYFAVDSDPCVPREWEDIRLLARHIHDLFPPTDTVPGVTLIRRANTRKFIDHDALAALLRKESLLVREATFEMMTPEEQIRLMQNTRILIGPHGAGHTNAVFMPEKCVIYELFPKGFLDIVYRRLADAFGHAWGMIESDRDPALTRTAPERLAPLFRDGAWPAFAEITNLVQTNVEARRYVRDIDGLSVRPELIVAQLRVQYPKQWNACCH